MLRTKLRLFLTGQSIFRLVAFGILGRLMGRPLRAGGTGGVTRFTLSELEVRILTSVQGAV